MSKDYYGSSNKTKLIGSSFLLNKLSTNGKNKLGSSLVLDKEKSLKTGRSASVYNSREKEANLKYSTINIDLNDNYCNCNKFKISYFCRECNLFICHFCFRVIF